MLVDNLGTWLLFRYFDIRYYTFRCFSPAQYYGSTELSIKPSMTTPSIEEGTAHNPIFLIDVPQSLFNQPNYLVELSDKEILVMKFRACQNM